jgi:hypothetical protein
MDDLTDTRPISRLEIVDTIDIERDPFLVCLRLLRRSIEPRMGRA